jgi:hypothetical protein
MPDYSVIRLKNRWPVYCDPRVTGGKAPRSRRKIAAFPGDKQTQSDDNPPTSCLENLP